MKDEGGRMKMKECGEGVFGAVCCVLTTDCGERYYVPFAFLCALCVLCVFALRFGFGRKF